MINYKYNASPNKGELFSEGELQIKLKILVHTIIIIKPF